MVVKGQGTGSEEAMFLKYHMFLLLREDSILQCVQIAQNPSCQVCFRIASKFLVISFALLTTI